VDRATFEYWLDAYKRAWETRNPGSAVDLDGTFRVEIDADGRCTEFREWWHKRG